MREYEWTQMNEWMNEHVRRSAYYIWFFWLFFIYIPERETARRFEVFVYSRLENIPKFYLFQFVEPNFSDAHIRA